MQLSAVLAISVTEGRYSKKIRSDKWDSELGLGLDRTMT